MTIMCMVQLLSTASTTIIPNLSQHCYKCCYSDNRNLLTVMEAGGLAPYNLIQPTISLKMPVPSQGHCGFPVFRLLTDFVCLLTDEVCLTLWKIAQCSVILLLPLFAPKDFLIFRLWGYLIKVIPETCHLYK